MTKTMAHRRGSIRTVHATPALAQKTVVGVTDTEIKIGQSARSAAPPACMARYPPPNPITSR